MKLKRTQLDLPVRHLRMKRLVFALNFHHHVKRKIHQKLVEVVLRKCKQSFVSIITYQYLQTEILLELLFLVHQELLNLYELDNDRIKVALKFSKVTDNIPTKEIGNVY